MDADGVVILVNLGVLLIVASVLVWLIRTDRKVNDPPNSPYGE